MDDRHAATLLLAVLRERWDEALRLAATVDPARFVRTCIECEVHPWVHAQLERSGRLGLLPPAVAEGLLRARSKVRGDNLMLLARLEQALDALAAVGVVPVVLKGGAAIHRFYRFDERALLDIDLLLREQDLQRGLSALRALGYVPPPGEEKLAFVRGSHHLPLDGFEPLPVPLELHWNLVQETRFSVDAHTLFARAQPLDVAGRRALRLEDHDAAAHLLLHHFTHYFAPGLKGLVDLRHLAATPGFDWDRVVARVREWRAETACASAIDHARSMWPELVPQAAARALPLTRLRRALLRPLRSGNPLEPYRGSRTRRGQLVLATLLIERPAALPAWLLHRARRARRSSAHPLDS